MHVLAEKLLPARVVGRNLRFGADFGEPEFERSQQFSTETGLDDASADHPFESERSGEGVERVPPERVEELVGRIGGRAAALTLTGAGGGGFLQVVTKRGVSKAKLQERLRSVFSDTDIGVWDCELV